MGVLVLLLQSNLSHNYKTVCLFNLVLIICFISSSGLILPSASFPFSTFMSIVYSYTCFFCVRRAPLPPSCGTGDHFRPPRRRLLLIPHVSSPCPPPPLLMISGMSAATPPSQGCVTLEPNAGFSDSKNDWRPAARCGFLGRFHCPLFLALEKRSSSSSCSSILKKNEGYFETYSIWAGLQG